jgi:predicted MFS family arabinose efflux permease
VSTLAMGLVDGFAVWLALRALAGVASAWVLILVSAWALERLAEAGRPQLAGLFYAGVGTGVAIAGVVCLFGFRADANWLALGAIALLAAGATRGVFSFGHDPRTEETAPPRSGGWLLILTYGVYGFGYIVPATFLPAMARQIVADPLAFGSAWPVLGVAAAASTLIASRLGAANPRRMLAVCMLLLAAGVAAPLFVPGLAGILLSAVLVGATFVTMTLAGMQEARRIHGDAARPLMAAMTAAFAVGQLIGPVLVALAQAIPHGFTIVLIAATAGLLASAIALSVRARAGGASAPRAPASRA